MKFASGVALLSAMLTAPAEAENRARGLRIGLDPTDPPTKAPSKAPTDAPAPAPTDAPVADPTEAPVSEPTGAPVETPTDPPEECSTIGEFFFSTS